MNPIPFPSMAYLTFQKDLAASGQIAHLADILAHTHWLYEGWTGLQHPLTGEPKRLYEQHACYMVRYCSEVERQVATSRAERWGVNAFEALKENMARCDVTPERAEELLRSFIRQCISVQRFSLVHGVEKLAPQEEAHLARIEADREW